MKEKNINDRIAFNTRQKERTIDEEKEEEAEMKLQVHERKNYKPEDNRPKEEDLAKDKNPDLSDNEDGEKEKDDKAEEEPASPG